MITRSTRILKLTVVVCLCAISCGSTTLAQESIDRYIQPRRESRQPSTVRQAQFESPPVASGSQRARLRQITAPQYRATVRQHHSQLVVSDQKITRIAVTAPEIVNFVQYTEKEVALIGLAVGSTDLTMWFENDPNPVMYEITVTSGAPKASSPHGALIEVGQKLRTVFPRSRVQLIPVADQIVVKGQAHDAADAEQIMKLLMAQFGRDKNTVVNRMRVPGEAQVLLRVQIAELSRVQLRKLGVTCRDLLSRSRKAKSFGPTTAGISGVFEANEITRMMRWLSSNGTISYLAEPTLTVLSGHSASFLSGGEYAVPTVVRDGEKHTQFRNYGTKLKVTPSILDRDLIRLHVSPEFSQIDEKRTVDGIPGTNVRRVETVVELREGQTIAIGGLISRQMRTQVDRKPGLRPKWFSREATEADTELLIVVTPEIVRPMDPTEVPPMPNYNVTHPSDTELFGLGMSEGQPGSGDSGNFVESARGAISMPSQPVLDYTQEGCAPSVISQPQLQSPMVPTQPAPSSIAPNSIAPGSIAPSTLPPPVLNPVTPTPGDQPSSGDQLFELPTGPDQAVLPPPYPTEPPARPPITASKPAPKQIFRTTSQPASYRTQGSIIRPRQPLAHSVPKRKKAKVDSAVMPASFEAGHSLSGGKSTPVSRPKPNSKGSPKPVIRPSNTPRIQPRGQQRPASELPPIGHSISRSSSSKFGSQGQ